MVKWQEPASCVKRCYNTQTDPMKILELTNHRPQLWQSKNFKCGEYYTLIWCPHWTAYSVWEPFSSYHVHWGIIQSSCIQHRFKQKCCKWTTYFSTSNIYKKKNQYSLGKGKFVPMLNYAPHHEDVLGSWSIAPHILNFGTRWRVAVSFMPWAKSPWYPLGPRPSLDTVVKRQTTCLCQKSNPSHPPYSLVTILTEPSLFPFLMTREKN